MGKERSSGLKLPACSVPKEKAADALMQREGDLKKGGLEEGKNPFRAQIHQKGVILFAAGTS